jgi:DNA-binding NarL/FixJ family response regulator
MAARLKIVASADDASAASPSRTEEPASSAVGPGAPRNADDALAAAAALLVAAGYRVIAPGDLARGDSDDLPGASIAEEQPGNGDDAPARNLSAREHEVLMLLAEGAPNKVIARRLGISVHTAKFHIASILAKLGAANRTDAIAIAMREGLVLI